MATAIGSLFVSLGLDTAAFSNGVKQAQTRVAKFAGNLSQQLGKLGDVPGVGALQKTLMTFSRVGPAGLAAGAGAMVASLSLVSISAMNTAKEISNLSRLSNATPEEFQRWGYAAEQVGVSQEKMGDILKDVNDRVGDFIATGGGPMADFFERIGPKVGVTAEQFRNLSGPDALQLYVSSLEKANVNQQDFTFFMEAMASDSTALLPILKNNGEMAKQYGDRLEALGGVMGGDTVARLAKMRSAMAEVGVVMGGVKNALGAAFAPVLSSLASAFVSLMTKGSALRLIFDGLTSVVSMVAQTFAAVVNIISHVASAIWNAVGAVASWVNSLTGIGTMISTVWGYVAGFVNKLIIGISNLLDATDGLGGAFVLLGEVVGGVWSGIVTSAQAIPIGLNAAWETIKAGFYGMLGGLTGKWQEFLLNVSGSLAYIPFMGAESAGVAGAAAKASSDMVSFERSAKAATAAAAELGTRAAGMAAEGFGIAADALAKLKLHVDETSTALDPAGTNGGLGAGLDAAAKKGGAAKEKLSDLQKVLKGLREEAELLQATMGMSDLDASIWEKQREAGVQSNSANGQLISSQMKMIDGMKKLKSATEEWKQTISSAFSDFITKGGSFKSVLSSIIGKLAEMAFNKGFEALWGGVGGKGLGSLASGALKLFGFANGTNAAPGGPAKVWERGGEIMNLPRGTQVIPHDISKRMADTAGRQGGGGQISIGFDETIGSLTATMRDIAGQVVQVATPTIQRGAVKLTSQASHRSKAFMGI